MSSLLRAASERVIADGGKSLMFGSLSHGEGVITHGKKHKAPIEAALAFSKFGDNVWLKICTSSHARKMMLIERFPPLR